MENNQITQKSYYTTVSKKTISVREFSQLYGLGLNKAYQIVNIEGFPCLRVGKKILVIVNKLDSWIEQHIGDKF